MKISFVIPAYNEESYLGACLTSLQEEIRRNGHSIKTEIIVVNNASTDRTEDVARAFPGVRIVHEPTKGLPLARQRGFEEAAGDIVACIDADVHVRPNWIPTMLRAFSANPHVVAVSGPCIYYDLPFFWRVCAWPYEMIFGKLAHLISGYFVVGGNCAVKKNAVVRVGGINTDLTFYGEDSDLAKRLRTVGKVHFLVSLAVRSSARRFNAEGVLRTTATYAANFLCIAILGRPIPVRYRDIR